MMPFGQVLTFLLCLSKAWSSCFEDHADYAGNDLTYFHTPGPEKCQQACETKAACRYWTFVKAPTNRCFLKTARLNVHRNRPHLVSGPKYCSSYEELKVKYCGMNLEEKRHFLLSDKVADTQVEQLLASVRACRRDSSSTQSCKHSAEEVLDYSGRSKLESKINRQCKEDCQKEKKKVEDDLSKIGEKGDEIFSMEEDKVNEEIDDIDKVAGAFDSLSEMEVEEAEDDAAAAEAASSMNQNFQNQLLKANIKDKDELKEKADEAAKKDPKNFKRVVSAHIFSKRATALAKEKKLNSRKIAFKATIGKAKSGLKSVGSMDNAAKASVALGGGLRGISKIMAGTKDGDVDPKAIAMGVLDVVDGLSAFLPSPASVITGAVSSIVGMFLGGGGPTTEEVIMEEFKKQKEFIEEQFTKQEKLFKNLMTQTELESVKAKGLGVLDALQSRYNFIAVYEGLGTCLDEEVVVEITDRVEYFMDQSDAASVKHAFDVHCPKLLSKREATDSQQICGFLLYTYLVIEEKRHEILTVMITLLANTEKYESLTSGYLNVQSKQKDTLREWISKTFGITETYCGLFLYHKGIWSGRQDQMQYVMDSLAHFGPDLSSQKSKCIKIDCFINGYDMPGHDLGDPMETRDAGNCQIACSRNTQCNYWSYDPRQKKCWLKREAGSIKSNSAIQSGPKKCLEKSKTEELEIKNMKCGPAVGINLSGGEILSSLSHSTTYEKCQSQCQRTNRCIFFIVAYNKCWLKYSWTSYKTNLGSSVFSGQAWCPASLDTCYYKQWNFSGHNLYNLKGISSMSHCQSLCLGDIRCKTFTYDTKDKICWLKDGWERRHASTKYVSSWQSCACGKYGAYFSRGPSKTVSNVGNIELCYKLCKSTSSCKAWTYDLNKFSCTLNENSNALKSYMVHKAYHSAYNARISGPKECRLWR